MLVTDSATKRRVVWAAVQLLKRAGMDVVETFEGDTVMLQVEIPPDSEDEHGDRLRAAQAAQG